MTLNPLILCVVKTHRIPKGQVRTAKTPPSSLNIRKHTNYNGSNAHVVRTAGAGVLFPVLHNVGGLMGRLDSHMPRILSSLLFSHARGEPLLFPNHAYGVGTAAAVGLCLHLSSSCPGSSGCFQERCSITGIDMRTNICSVFVFFFVIKCKSDSALSRVSL